MKNIVLTGGAGFIGANFIEYLLANTDCKITTIDRLDFSGNLNRLSHLANMARGRLNVVFHDLKAPLNDLVRARVGKSDTIIHMAAGSHVDRSIDYPLEFVMDNVVGTANLLEFARSLDSLEAFHYFSTDEVFGPAPKGYNYKEWDRYRSGNPYSATKAGAEELCIAYENTYKMPIYVTHTMNVYGPWQHPEKYIPKCIKKIMTGEVLTIHADKTKTVPGSRFYIHAQDVADAVVFLRKNFESGDKYNVVGEKEVNNLELAKLIADYLGRSLNYELVDFHSSRPGHDLRYALDGTKMKLMGWEPRQKLEQRLADTVEWYLEHQEDWFGLVD